VSRFIRNDKEYQRNEFSERIFLQRQTKKYSSAEEIKYKF